MQKRESHEEQLHEESADCKAERPGIRNVEEKRELNDEEAGRREQLRQKLLRRD